MHVGTMTRRRFSPDEIELLQVVADRVALALRVRLSNRSRVVIEAFQRTFLPEVIPYLPGLRLATRYLPAATAIGVGGDWFDAFLRPDGDIVLVMGDVAGHGLPAASLMGKMRNALRAHALMPGTAIDIVTRADEFHRHFGGGELVTLLVGLLSSDTQRFRYVSAGHPPPLVVADGRRLLRVRTVGPTRRSACRTHPRSRRRRWCWPRDVGPPVHGWADRTEGRVARSLARTAPFDRGAGAGRPAAQ